MTPSDVLEEWEERAAIFEYDAADEFPTRAEAESEAWHLMVDKHGPQLAARAMAQHVREQR